MPHQKRRKLNTRNCEVLALGSPIIDRSFNVTDSFLEDIPGEKGGSLVVKYSVLQKIEKRYKKQSRISPGGSAANLILCHNRLGRKVAMVGMIGQDELGKKYKEALCNLGVETLFSSSEDEPTGQVACLTTPDGQRTMRSYLGASCQLRSCHLKKEYFKGIRLLHCEGYSIYNGDGELTQAAMKMAKDEGALVSIDLASFELVRRYKSFIIELLEKYVDIVFANEDEAKVICEGSAQEACNYLATLCKVAVVTLGAKGCRAQTGDEQVFVPTKRVRCIDATGAGDSFAAGFLHKYLEGGSLKDCCKVGHILGAEAIQVVGAQISEEKWHDLLQKVTSFGKNDQKEQQEQEQKQQEQHQEKIQKTTTTTTTTTTTVSISQESSCTTLVMVKNI